MAEERSGPDDSINCTNCGGQNCTQIVIHLREDDTVRFFNCRICEAKWWEREGHTIDLQEVLQRATRRRPRRPAASGGRTWPGERRYR